MILGVCWSGGLIVVGIVAAMIGSLHLGAKVGLWK